MLFSRRHHQSCHLLQDKRRVSTSGELAQVEIHGLQVLLQLLLKLQLLIESSLLARHLGGTPGAVQTFGGIINRAQSAKSQAAQLATQIHVAKIHLHGHARKLVVILAVSILSETTLGNPLLSCQSRRVDG